MDKTDSEKIKILFAKIIEDKTKDELLNTFKNVEWKTICNRREREKNQAGLFMERIKDKFLAKKHQDKKMAPEKKVFLEFSNQSSGDDLVGFYNVIEKQYNSQTKENLKSKLKWLKGDNNLQEKCCYYCGISERILTVLYNVQEFRTKRNRGEWFEIDRKETKDIKNIYSSNNMVLSGGDRCDLDTNSAVNGNNSVRLSRSGTPRATTYTSDIDLTKKMLLL